MSLRSQAALIVSLFILCSVSGVLLRPLTPVDETRYVSVAWEMWQNGSYLVPTKNLELYTHKPPLLFWTINLVWLITGVSEIAARLVAPFYSLIGLLLTGLLARQLWPEDGQIGARAIIAQTGLVAFALAGGLTMFDGMLTTATVAGMLALVKAADTGHRRWWIALGVAITAGVLSKGPVILFHLGPAMLLLPFWSRGASTLGTGDWLKGLGLALAVALGVLALWLLPAIIIGGPEYREAVLWKQSAGRIVNSFSHVRPWWFLISVLPLLLFPLFYSVSLWRATVTTSMREPGLRLAFVWAVSALVLFSLISGKQAHYLAPELPAFALIAARLSRDLPRFSVLPAVIVVAALSLLGVAIAAGLVPLGRAAPLFQPRLGVLAWSALLLLVCWIAWRLRGLAGCAVLSLGVVFSLNALISLTALYPNYDTHNIARVIVPFEEQGIAIYGQAYNAEFGFTGRMSRQVDVLAAPEQVTDWMTAHPEGVIVAKSSVLDPGWPPMATISYRNSPYAIWSVDDAPDKTKQP